MAKQKVTCAACGGSFDGTPSGQKKHELTLKHVTGGRLSADPADLPIASALAHRAGAIEAAMTANVPAVTMGYEPVPDQPGVYFAALPHGEEYDRLEAALEAAKSEIGREQDALRRREADLRWRRKHRPEQADEYYASKVAPIEAAIGASTREKEEIEARMAELAAEARRPANEFRDELASEIERRFAGDGITISAEGAMVRVGTPDATYMEVTVYMPRQEFVEFGERPRRPTIRFSRPAEINIPSWSDKSIGRARQVVRLVSAAIEIAEFVNAAYGL